MCLITLISLEFGVEPIFLRWFENLQIWIHDFIGKQLTSQIKYERKMQDFRVWLGTFWFQNCNQRRRKPLFWKFYQDPWVLMWGLPLWIRKKNNSIQNGISIDTFLAFNYYFFTNEILSFDKLWRILDRKPSEILQMHISCGPLVSLSQVFPPFHVPHSIPLFPFCLPFFVFMVVLSLAHCSLLSLYCQWRLPFSCQFLVFLWETLDNACFGCSSFLNDRLPISILSATRTRMINSIACSFLLCSIAFILHSSSADSQVKISISCKIPQFKGFQAACNSNNSNNS